MTLNNHSLDDVQFLRFSWIQQQKQPLFQEIFPLLDKPYQNRSSYDHRRSLKYLHFVLPQYSQIELKMLYFYLQSVQGQLQINPPKYSNGTLIIKQINNAVFVQKIENNKPIIINAKQNALLISGTYIQKCKILKNISLDQQFQFLQKSKYFGLVPRKRRLLFMKYCISLSFSMNQTICLTNEQVYYIRKGQFSLIQRCQNKNIQIYELGPDQIIGYFNSEKKFKCKDSQGIIYKIGKQLFEQNLLYYFQDLLKSNQQKKKICVQNSYQKNKLFRLTQAGYKKHSISAILPSYNNQNNAKINNTFQKFNSVNNIEETQEKPINYLIEKKKYDSVLHKKIKQTQQANNEHRQLLKLYEKKGKCVKMRQLSKPAIPKTKGEILFSLFKHSWQFERQKRLDRKR